MPINFNCDRCGRKYQVADSLAAGTATCRCGARLSIPARPNADRSPSAISDREYIPSPDEAAQRAIEEINPYRLPHQRFMERLVNVTSPGLPQIFGASVVGAIFGFSGAMKSKEDPSAAWILSAVLGGALIGAFAGSLLSYRDKATARATAGRRPPLLVRLYLGKPLIAIVMWTITAFGVALTYVAYLAATTP